MQSHDEFVASLHRLMRFSQSVLVSRKIVEIAIEPKQTFWIMTLNLLFDAASLEWCKVFGSFKEGTHWKNLVPKDQHNNVRRGLLDAIEFTESEWEAYHKTIVDFRNQMVAHHDLNATVTRYPEYGPALIASDFIFSELRRRADPDFLGGIPSSLDVWSRGVANNMTPIVKKAFEASAKLGSNIPND